MKILLLTPPFVQLNTPYPATTVLKGFLKQEGYNVKQADIGIELFNAIFCKTGLEKMFVEVSKQKKIDASIKLILNQREEITSLIDLVVHFLQGKDPTFAYKASNPDFWPIQGTIHDPEDMEWLFGQAGIQDKAKYLSTLFIESVGAVITECIDKHFGFSKYGESLGLSASSFSPLSKEIKGPETLVGSMLKEIALGKISEFEPDIVGISIPFPGNLYGALKCCKAIKEYNHDIKIVLGGGYVNTELRNITDGRIFKYVDFICLDDGELPLLQIIRLIEEKISTESLIRTIIQVNGEIKNINPESGDNIPFCESGTPDYSDLHLDQYLSFLEVVNPMHRLWNDGRWNKLTLAHGCYWHKCAFCDTSLDYINRFEPGTAILLADRMEAIVKQTGQSGFHFTDEAAPPVLLRHLSEEIINRNLQVTWWTNIRFEKAFTQELCELMSKAGCIAVTGGMETASDRLLLLMKKGVTIEQAAKTTLHFQQAGIMVHAYLMYGFPTQTERETIDSLEIIRQFFENGLIQSAFWHQFTMTLHSPVGLHPESFGTKITEGTRSAFANNNLKHEESSPVNHSKFASGLKKAIYNYMHGIGLEKSLSFWFKIKIPETSVPKTYIRKIISKKL